MRVWIGDAAQIRASRVRKQKTDRRDAAHSGFIGEECFSADMDTVPAERISGSC